ncbi:hypothetical protein C8F04DRAFT_693829 [Mycena alexandri]|uniref:Uncharacterized protein n=1 Tax=Mycena alexandri TaxID=1745969 RepID=A0AAD6X0S8_9AGAR|nr:hypothetical protein C8F04DRAFT_693829 [Mycena alexandri]
MPSNLAPHQIYSSQLEQLKYGYALWCPEPETGHNFQYAEVRPGDVGYFQEGGFCRLFNVSLPEDDQENSLGVPDGFEPLHLPKGGVLTRDPFLPAQALRSSSVYDVERSAKAGGDLQVVSAGVGVGYSCSKKRGALLNLSQPLKSERILAGIHIKNYVRQHYQSWYDFASALGRDIETGVIVLVTGCMKTYEWTSAVFNNTSKDTGNPLLLPPVMELNKGLKLQVV